MFREDRHLIGYLQFDSMAPKLIETLRGFVEIIVGKNQPVMVILDGDHHAKEVFRELVAYSAFVTPGSYLICEDTNVELVGVLDGDPGPASAIEEFLKTHCNFRVDGSRDKFGLSFNSGGWLRRVA
jgi:cephalosporin hydroxylase